MNVADFERLADLVAKADDFEVMSLRNISRNKAMLLALAGNHHLAERLASLIEAEHEKRGL